jgi:HEAT repeat protein
MSNPRPVSGPKTRRFPWGLVVFAILAIPLGVLVVFLCIPTSPIYAPKIFGLEPSVDGRVASEYANDLSSPDPAVRVKAAQSLSKMSTGAKQHLPKLLTAMRTDPDGEVRTFAADAVGKMCPAPTDPDAAKDAYAAVAVNDLAAALTDDDKRVRMNAALALLRLKGRAKPAIPALIAAANDPENGTNLGVFPQSVRQTVVVALGEAAAGTADGVPTLADIVAAPIDVPPPPRTGRRPEAESKRLVEAWAVRRAAVKGLGLAGEHGKVAAPKVRVLLKGDPNADRSQHDEDKNAAEEALQMMGLPRDGS